MDANRILSALLRDGSLTAKTWSPAFRACPTDTDHLVASRSVSPRRVDFCAVGLPAEDVTIYLRSDRTRSLYAVYDFETVASCL